MPRCLALSLSLVLLALSSCRSTPLAGAEDDFVLVYLKTGPHGAERSNVERETIQADHLANIGRMADAGQLVIAGPFGTPSHDSRQRGIFVFDVRTVEEARVL